MRATELACGLIPFDLLLSLTDAGPVIVFYHAVSDTPVRHIAPLYRHKTIPEFEADLDFLLSHLPPLSLHDVLEVARGERGRRGLFVTFDDGLREVLEQAAPVLCRKGVPAALFVNPAFIDNADLFYRFKTALLLEAISTASAAAAREAIILLERSGIQEPTLAAGLRAVPYSQRTVLDDVAQVLGVDLSSYLREQRPFLTRAELMALQDAGWAIGAHGMDHTPYSEISLDEQLRQTRDSVKVVEEMLHPTHRLFAFPFTAQGVTDEFYSAAHAEGMACAFFGTGGWFHEPARRLLNRVSLEGDKPLAGPFLRQSLGLAGVRRLLGRRSGIGY